MALMNEHELARLFAQAAIAHGYAQESGRSKIADQFLSDLNAIVPNLRHSQPHIALLMKMPDWPWCRYCAAMLFMQDNKTLAMEVIRELGAGDGLFAPVCIALSADYDNMRS